MLTVMYSLPACRKSVWTFRRVAWKVASETAVADHVLRSSVTPR